MKVPRIERLLRRWRMKDKLKDLQNEIHKAIDGKEVVRDAYQSWEDSRVTERDYLLNLILYFQCEVVKELKQVRAILSKKGGDKDG